MIEDIIENQTKVLADIKDLLSQIKMTQQKVYCREKHIENFVKCLASDKQVKLDESDDESDNEFIVTENAKDTNEGIYAVTDKNGEQWVRVKIFDENFRISKRNYVEKNGDDTVTLFTWDEAMEKVKKIGLTLFTKKQGCLMLAYKDEINAVLREIGGDELDDEYYWSSTECNAYNAAYFNFGNGYLYYYYTSKCNSSSFGLSQQTRPLNPLNGGCCTPTQKQE